MILLLGAHSATVPAQDRDIFLQFAAADGNWSDRSFTGHAFLCVQRKIGSGLKEECFGFYPRANRKALVGGPGVVDSEFDFAARPPTRFTHAKASLRKAITGAQRQKVLAFIRTFDKDFSLTPGNCVSFANGVAKLAGLKTPSSISFPTPVEYLNELRRVNPGAFAVAVLARSPCTEQRAHFARTIC
jgi:hypothetical protein